jgi:hypothetical protein
MVATNSRKERMAIPRSKAAGTNVGNSGNTTG